jgi:hypothetical protein
MILVISVTSSQVLLFLLLLFLWKRRSPILPKKERQTDAKKPQRFLILQQLLDCHQIDFSHKKINNNKHHLGSSKPQFFANFTQTRQSTGSSCSCRPQTDRCTTGNFFCSRPAGYKNIKLYQISSAFPSSTAK